MLWWESWVLMMLSNLGFCCFCSYACLLPSNYLKCSLPSIYMIRPCPSCNPGCVRTPQSSAVSVILGSCDPEILGVSELLGVKLPLGPSDPSVTKFRGSWDPGCVRAPGSGASSGCCGTDCRFHTQGLLRALAQTRRVLQSFYLLFCRAS